MARRVRPRRHARARNDGGAQRVGRRRIRHHDRPARPNLFIGNNPRANGTYVPLRPGREDPAHERADATALAEAAAGRKLSPSEISAYWVRRTLDFVRAEPARFLKLTLRKLFLTMNAAEIADAEDFYVHAEHAPLLRGLAWVNHFGILLPLAAAGVVFTWRNRRDLWILYLLAVALILAVVPFYVLARYRYPLVLPLAIFAASALVRARELLARPRRSWGGWRRPSATKRTRCAWPRTCCRPASRRAWSCSA
jgi:hypothetical protein